MGTYYPSRDHYFNAIECPTFWQHHKIQIVPVNLTAETYFQETKFSVIRWMIFNIIVVFIASVFLIKNLLNNARFMNGLEDIPYSKYVNVQCFSFECRRTVVCSSLKDKYLVRDSYERIFEVIETFLTKSTA